MAAFCSYEEILGYFEPITSFHRFGHFGEMNILGHYFFLLCDLYIYFPCSFSRQFSRVVPLPRIVFCRE